MVAGSVGIRSQSFEAEGIEDAQPAIQPRMRSQRDRIEHRHDWVARRGPALERRLTIRLLFECGDVNCVLGADMHHGLGRN